MAQEFSAELFIMPQKPTQQPSLQLLPKPRSSSDGALPAQDGKKRLLFLSSDKNLPRHLPEDVGGAEEVVFVHHETQIEQALSRQSFMVIVVGMPVSHEVMLELRSQMASGPEQWILIGELTSSMHEHLTPATFAVLSSPAHMSDLAILCKSAFEQAQLNTTNTGLRRSFGQSSTMLEVIMRHSKDMMYVLDEKGHFSYASEHLEPFLGISQGSLIGQHYSTIVDPLDRELAEYVFQCRKDNLNSHHDVEVRLKSQRLTMPFNTATTTVLLSTAGIYDEGSDTEGSLAFRGMYGIVHQMEKFDSGPNVLTHQQAYMDALTGLPNRRLLKDRLSIALAQAKRKKRLLALMFLDLEKFKKVNDTFGHPFGDQMLREVAGRLKLSLRSGDTLARYGGDEFIVLLPEVYSPNAATTIARKITAALEQPFVLEGKEINIGASVGIALYPDADLYGTDEDAAEAIIRHADMAMYHAKNTPPRKYSLYSEKMTQSAAHNIQIEADLRDAIHMGNIDVLYRPLVSLKDGRVVSTETNIRWLHPERGLIPQESFWGVAKQTGLIIDINQQACIQACQQLLEWRSQGLGDFKLGLKLFSAEVWQQRFPENFLDILNESGVRASEIEVEIEEETVLQDIEVLAPRLRHIGREGVALAIGQFGGGYFPLFHLRRFPVNSLRIDRAFTDEIQGYNDQPVIGGIVAMAKALGIQVVAEGVMTRQQISYLRRIGCDTIAGTFFGPPRSASEMVNLLQRDSKLI